MDAFEELSDCFLCKELNYGRENNNIIILDTGLGFTNENDVLQLH